MISFNKKFLFLHITKTAGTSIEEALYDDSCILTSEKWKYNGVGFSAPLNHLTLQQIKSLNIPNYNNLFKFTVVRNPWDRIISECECVHIQRVFNIHNKNMSMTDKIKIACEIACNGGYGNHFIQQHKMYGSIKNLDYIAKFENLIDDFRVICSKIGLDGVELHKRNSYREPVNYRNYYTEETAELVRCTFEKEIADFNYCF